MSLPRRAARGLALAASMTLLMTLPFISSVRPALAAELAGLAARVDPVHQSACPSPRPPMQLQTQALGDGRLQVTLRAGVGALLAIRFGAIQNARVEVPGSGQTYASNGEMKPPSGATSVTFVVVSDAAGRAGQAPPPVMVPLTAFDGCGVGQPWSTFVGGGTSTLQSIASIADTQVSEGDAGNTVLTFTVKLSVPSSREITVAYATADGSAKAGTDYLAASGTVTFVPGETSKTITVQVRGNVTAEPDKTFTVSLSNPVNAGLGQAQATARILNDDTEPGASGDAYTVSAGQTLTVGEGAGPPPGLLVNDRAGSQAIQITSFGGLSAPGDVTTHPAGTTASLGNGGTLRVNADGSFTFLAPSGFSGAFSFRYRAASSAGTSDATVIITVVPVASTDIPPVAVADAATVAEDSGATAVDVLANDTDSDGGPKTITAKTNGSNGATVTITGGGSGLTYQPAANFCGTDTFSYTINGGPGAAQTATVTATVTCAQDKPTRAAITATAQANVPLRIPALVGIVDPDAGMNGCKPTYQIVNPSPISPAGGDLAIDTSVTPNVLVFDPQVGTTGTYTFSYVIEDSGCPGPVVTSDPVSVTVTVVGTDGTTNGPLLWFVNNNPGACPSAPCDGRLSHPFQTLADFGAANASPSPTAPKDNHIVFLYESATAYQGPVTLRSGQKLIGQDASRSLAALVSLTVDPAWAALPTTDVAGGTVTVGSSGSGTSLTLGSGNTLRGFTLGSPTNTIALAGNNFGTLTFAAGTGADPADVTVNATGPALFLIKGTVNGALISTTSTAGGITLTDIAGTFDMGGGALAGGDAPSLTVQSPTTPSTNTVALTYSGTITAGTETSVSIVNRPAGADPITLSGAITGVAGKSTVIVSQVAGGAITFAGKVTAPSTTAAAIAIVNNGTDASVAFDGGLDIDTTTGPGFYASLGGSVTVTGSGNTIDSMSGTALQIQDVTIGTAGLTFERISAGNNTTASDPTGGIVLQNTGTLAGLTVTGNGTAESGGTIQHTSLAGIHADNTSNLSITDMVINSPDNNGILARNAHGTWKIANSSITNVASSNAIAVNNVNTDLTKLTVTGTTISNTGTNALGIWISADGTSNMTVSIEGQSAFMDLKSRAVAVTPGAAASGTVNLTIKESSFTNIAPANNWSVVDLGMVRSTMTLTANIEKNTFDEITLASSAAAVLAANGATAPNSPTLNATVKDNAFMDITRGSVIQGFTNGSAGPTKLLIDGNEIDRLKTNDTRPIVISAVGDTSQDVTVQNNKLGQQGTLWPGDAAHPAVEAIAQDNATVRALLDDNTITVDAGSSGRGLITFAGLNSTTLDVTLTDNSVSGTGSGVLGTMLQVGGASAKMNVLATGNHTPARDIILLATGGGALTYNADLPGTNTYQFFTSSGATTTSTSPTLPALPPLP